MLKEIEEGAEIPFIYGICWFNYNRKTVTVSIIPFNWVIRFIRNLYRILKCPPISKSELFDKAVQESFEREKFNITLEVAIENLENELPFLSENHQKNIKRNVIDLIRSLNKNNHA